MGNNVTLFPDDITVYVEIPKECTNCQNSQVSLASLLNYISF